MKILRTLITGIVTLATVSCSHQTALKTSPQIYSYESDANGFNTKNFFYDNGEEVIAFDTQFTAEQAQKSIDFLRTKTANPIKYVVVTHPNPDKFNGASVFQKLGAKIIASEKTATSIPTVHAYKKYYFVNMAKMFTEETYPQQATIDVTFKQTKILKLSNGDTIELSELSAPGVSTNQTVAYIPSQKSLIVGDLVHHNAHAWLEGGIVNGKATPTIKDWINDLKELQHKFSPDTTVLGGRGEAASLKVVAPQQIAYLQKAEEIVEGFAHKKDDQTLNIKTAFEEAFPQYQLSYMIQYGVYGLVQAKK